MLSLFSVFMKCALVQDPALNIDILNGSGVKRVPNS
jgi:hypothetical protein